VENFEAEIEKLKRNATTRSMIVTSIGQEIEHSQKEYDELLQGKQQEIDRVLRELEEQHSKKCEALKSKLQNLKESKQTVLGALKRNALEVSRKETGVTHFQAIIDYYNPEEHRAN
jgi:cell division septum initiation protein DivIVA